MNLEYFESRSPKNLCDEINKFSSQVKNAKIEYIGSMHGKVGQCAWISYEKKSTRARASKKVEKQDTKPPETTAPKNDQNPTDDQNESYIGE